MSTSTCTCGAAIIWVRMPSGKNMPVDPAPHPRGNVKLHHRVGAAAAGEVVQVGSAPELYLSHYATCPHATRHRKPRQKDLFADRSDDAG